LVRSRSSQLFAERLRDVLSTVDAAFVTSSANLAGAGSLLTFACRSLPCDEAVLAIRRGPLHQVRVELVADPAGARPESLHMEIDGTIFGPTFAGHGAVWTSLRDDDERLGPLSEVLGGAPSGALVLPVAVQGVPVGAVAMLSSSALSERDRRGAEPLLDGLGAALGAIVTQRFLVRLFAAIVPELMGEDAATDFSLSMLRHADRLESAPVHRRTLEICAAASRIGARGDEESALALDVLERFAQYADVLAGRAGATK
jgi:hypothetical protein